MKILIIALVVAMLFLAGCPGAGTQQGGTSAGTQQGGALGGSSGASGGTGTSGGAGTSGSGTTGGSTGGTSGGSDPFANWDMNAMIASGQPVYCEVSYNEEGFTGTEKLYIKGENMRVEFTSLSEGQTTQTVVIVKGKKQYMQYPESAELIAGVTCDWVYMDMDTIQACMPEDTEVEGSTEMEKYDEAPANYNCQYGTFGDEKFALPSIPAACDLGEYMCQIQEQMQPFEACEGLEGEALMACYQAASETGN